ncbi:Bacteriocin-protection, YdeI or OmpD-Associated [Pseudarcicella hirudinis]|uniref:Bacteriocin-protection, YdeI or OmpD-Associated n=1 Tax=Pseudarcicella hirudinis TaxID=1079859 RepID=A0A1I5XQK7_9BACT|nr:YdeI/OmpD-associated family protein [Pseudarcicella hirudinis]SFQ34234.1 Bacteriocin-protection, YdeI or OmpD-Associated [Pseudarcicella hirudinis]
MTSFTTILLRFGENGEKTGWTYIHIPVDIANEIKPDTRVSFRVKGTIDNFPIRQVALLPVGEGDFIIPMNANIRKGIGGKKAGASVKVSFELDESEFEFSEDFLSCLEDEPKALENFKKQPPSHQKYFSKWIEDAKTIETKTKRISQSVEGLLMGMNFGEMVRYFKARKDELER